MSGYITRYLYYKSGKSSITIPKKHIEANNFDWNHKDIIYINFQEFSDLKGLFLSKEGQGHSTTYLYYESSGKSEVTIPRVVLDANNLNWRNKDYIFLLIKEIEQIRGIFLYKKEENESKRV